MNAKDCEHIGYLLATRKSRQELHDDLLEMDPRIKDELAGFDEVLEQDEETEEAYARLLLEKYGTEWALQKGVTPEMKKKLWDQAAAEVRKGY